MDEIFFTSTPPLKGRVKQRYTDFIVEEVLQDGTVCEVKRFTKPWNEREAEALMNILPRTTEEHLHLELEKINTDTITALALIARGLNVSKKRIGYGGLKDKRAVTCQRISLYMPNTELVAKFGVKGLELRKPRWSNNRVELGDLKGNKFIITIRNIGAKQEEVKKIIEDFAVQAAKGVPNFYGNQRFGGKRMVTHKVGKLLLKGKFEEAIMLYLTETYEEEKAELKNARINLAKTGDIKAALKEFPYDARSELAILNHLVKFPNDYAGALGTLPKKIRYLFSHAHQSDLFNKMLTLRMRTYGADALGKIEGDVLVDGVPALLLPGFESVYAEGKAGEIEKQVMKEEGVTFEDFKTTKISELSSKGERKQIVLIPENFKIEKIFADEFNEGKTAVIISFELSKGNYATTILRELMKEEVF